MGFEMTKNKHETILKKLCIFNFKKHGLISKKCFQLQIDLKTTSQKRFAQITIMYNKKAHNNIRKSTKALLKAQFKYIHFFGKRAFDGLSLKKESYFCQSFSRQKISTTQSLKSSTQV